MKLKNVFLLILTLSFYTVANAQKVKLKKGFVLVDEEKKFEYEIRTLGSEFSLYSTGKENEIVFILRNNNGTTGNSDDDFDQLTFIKDNRKLETATLRGYPFKYFVEKLIKEKVLDLEGNINSDKLETFFSKYDERITDRTLRH